MVKILKCCLILSDNPSNMLGYLRIGSRDHFWQCELYHLLEDRYPDSVRINQSRSIVSCEVIKDFGRFVALFEKSLLLHLYDFTIHGFMLSSTTKNTAKSLEKRGGTPPPFHPFYCCVLRAPPWRRKRPRAPIIHVRQRWLARRHWQCERH